MLALLGSLWMKEDKGYEAHVCFLVRAGLLWVLRSMALVVVIEVIG